MFRKDNSHSKAKYLNISNTDKHFLCEGTLKVIVNAFNSILHCVFQIQLTERNHSLTVPFMVVITLFIFHLHWDPQGGFKKMLQKSKHTCGVIPLNWNYFKIYWTLV